MAIIDLTFKNNGTRYESDPVQINTESNIGLHLEHDSKIGEVVLKQRMSGNNFAAFKSEYYNSGVYDTAITGVVKGMYIKIICENNPVVAQILIPDE